MKHVLVTGGAGYVGAVLVPKLLEQGCQVTVIDWFLFGDTLVDHPNLSKLRGDICDRQLVAKALAGIDAVIHLACISNDPSFALDPLLGKRVNWDATKTLGMLAKKAGVKRFIFASSSSVYGVKAEKEVTEELPLEPLTDYSRYKAQSETYLLSLQDADFAVLVLRPATVCGYSPRMRLDLTVNLLTIQALVNNTITVFGGNQKRPNIHIQDMARIYCLSLTYPKKKIAGQIFNVGYENYTILEIAHMVQGILGDQHIDITISPTNDPRSYHVSSRKIKQLLGFTPNHTIEEAIRDIRDAYKRGKIPRPMEDNRYYNVKMMQTL